MKKVKQHKIETMTDLYRVVNKENLDRLAIDVYAFLNHLVSIKEIAKKKRVGVREFTGYVMLWKDDGITGFTGMKIKRKK